MNFQMDNNFSQIKLELGINAKKMIQQVQFNNKLIEDEIEKGIQLALEEILSTEKFSLKIKEQTIQSLEEIISKSLFSWEVKSKISNLVEKKLSDKIEKYADKIVEQLTKNLK